MKVLMNRKNEIFNIPNILSFLRLLLVPVFIVLFFSDIENSLYWAGFVFFFAGVTDIADGYIARKYNMITKLGRIIDPLADKLMQLSAFVCLAIAGIIPHWVISVLVAKELILVAGGALVLKKVKDVPSSNIYGKGASLVFYFITIAVIIFPMSDMLKAILLGGGLFLSILALVMYALSGSRFLRNYERNPK